jgi:hypothetical protein
MAGLQRRPLAALLLAGIMLSGLPARADFLVDDRASGDARSALGTSWRLVSDTVMGGVSRGSMQFATVAGRPCLRLAGTVSLENSGGFVQVSLDLARDGNDFDAGGYAGIELDVYGNGESYNLHLRTADNWLVWQSYRSAFRADPGWRTVRLPFSGFAPYRTSAPLDLKKLKRIGLVAIGREMQADLCLGRMALYR